MTPPQGAPVGTGELLGCGNAAEPFLSGCVSSGAVEVQPLDGNLVVPVGGVEVPGKGIPLMFGLTYNSLSAATATEAGYGWTDSYSMRLVKGSTGSITVTEEDGAQLSFGSGGGGYSPAAPRIDATLAAVSGGWRLVRDRSETFLFNASGQLTSISDPEGYVTKVSVGSAGSGVTDASGRKLIFSNSGSHLVKVTDPAGRSVTLGYDAAGELTTEANVAGGVTRFGYGSAHRLVSVTDALGHVTTVAYNPSGQVTSVTDPLGRKTSFAYSGNPLSGAGSISITDPLGNTSTLSYYDGELVSATGPGGVSVAEVVSPTTLGVTAASDPAGDVTSVGLDTFGDLTSLTDPTGGTNTASYNGFGEPLKETDATGTTTAYSYASNGSLMSATTGGTEANKYGYSAGPGEVTSLTDPAGATTTLTYDSHGDVTSITEPDGTKTTVAYNAIGEATSIGGPSGTTTIAYNAFGEATSLTEPGGATTAVTYDADGQPTALTEPDGEKVTYGYDADNELVSETQPDGLTTTYSYDADGELLGEGGTLAATGRQVREAAPGYRYGYDKLGQLTSMTTPLGATTTATYDRAGNMATITDPEGQVTTDSHNPDDELTSITYSNAATPPVSNLSYDSDGRLLSMTDGTGTSTWTYNTLGQLASSADGSGAKVSYAWNTNGDLTGLTYPNGEKLAYGYDSDNQMTSLKDPAGRTFSFSYNSSGELATQKDPNGTATSYTYNSAGALTTISESAGTKKLASIAYTLDKQNQTTAATTTGLPGPASSTYSYSAAGQLLDIDGKPAYSYDTSGDPTAEPAGKLSYNADLAPTSFTPTGGSATAFSYDADGNLTGSTSATTKTTYSWNENNKLTGISGPAGTETRTYNGAGTLVGEGSSHTRAHYVYGLSGIIADGTNSYIYGPAGPVEQLSAAGTPTYLTADALGSVRLLTDQAGAVVGADSYSPQGQLAAKIGSGTTPFGFTGAYTDPSGLVDLGARTYDPMTAAFTSLDPAVASSQEPYGYTGDNFLNVTDPSGLDAGGDSSTPVQPLLAGELPGSAGPETPELAPITDAPMTDSPSKFRLSAITSVDISAGGATSAAAPQGPAVSGNSTQVAQSASPPTSADTPPSSTESESTYSVWDGVVSWLGTVTDVKGWNDLVEEGPSSTVGAEWQADAALTVLKLAFGRDPSFKPLAKIAEFGLAAWSVTNTVVTIAGIVTGTVAIGPIGLTCLLVGAAVAGWQLGAAAREDLPAFWNALQQAQF
jgi:RHS repeat-associated protein